ncbi:hypothetical protein [Roseovarius salinarum]|uniref:hypothetical protein n=1 Tax=Roseovarius salinarum TaxID=1981892 RepID=UPI0012FFE172|nr:hypothetical protein [Roseovarius salinarum]
MPRSPLGFLLLALTLFAATGATAGTLPWNAVEFRLICLTQDELDRAEDHERRRYEVAEMDAANLRAALSEQFGEVVVSGFDDAGLRAAFGDMVRCVYRRKASVSAADAPAWLVVTEPEARAIEGYAKEIADYMRKTGWPEPKLRQVVYGGGSFALVVDPDMGYLDSVLGEYYSEKRSYFGGKGPSIGLDYFGVVAPTERGDDLELLAHELFHAFQEGMGMGFGASDYILEGTAEAFGEWWVWRKRTGGGGLPPLMVEYADHPNATALPDLGTSASYDSDLFWLSAIRQMDDEIAWMRVLFANVMSEHGVAELDVAVRSKGLRWYDVFQTFAKTLTDPARRTQLRAYFDCQEISVPRIGDTDWETSVELSVVQLAAQCFTIKVAEQRRPIEVTIGYEPLADGAAAPVMLADGEHIRRKLERPVDRGESTDAGVLLTLGGSPGYMPSERVPLRLWVRAEPEIPCTKLDLPELSADYIAQDSSSMGGPVVYRIPVIVDETVNGAYAGARRFESSVRLVVGSGEKADPCRIGLQIGAFAQGVIQAGRGAYPVMGLRGEREVNYLHHRHYEGHSITAALARDQGVEPGRESRTFAVTGGALHVTSLAPDSLAMVLDLEASGDFARPLPKTGAGTRHEQFSRDISVHMSISSGG